MFDINQHEAEWRQAHPDDFYSHAPKSIQWLIKNSGGLIKSEKQANYALVAFSVLMVIISAYLIFGGEDNKKTQIPLGNEGRTYDAKMRVPLKNN